MVVEEGGQAFGHVLLGTVGGAVDGGVFEFAVEAFDHAVGPGGFDFGAFVLDSMVVAGQVEGVGFFGASPVEAVGVFGAVVGEEGVGSDGSGLREAVEEPGGGLGGFAGDDFQVGPAGGAFDGAEGFGFFAAHLGQARGVDVEVAGRIRFELAWLG